MLQYIIFLLALYASPSNSEVRFVERTTFVELGATLMHYVILDNDEIAIDCSVSYTNTRNNATETIKVNLADENINYSGADVTKSKIRGLGRNVCGFKLVGFDYNDPERYLLNVAYNDHGVNKTKSFEVNSTIKDPAEIFDQTIRAKLGETKKITCGRQYSLHNLLYNPQHELVGQGSRFDYIIEHITMREIGVWDCTYGLAGSMDSFHRYFNITLITDQEIQTWYKEDNSYGILGCRFVYDEDYNAGNRQKIPPFCQLITPNRQIITISSNHRATERYTSIGTNFTDYICQIEFKLPLQVEEMGEWECKIMNTGGYINTIAKKATKKLTQHLTKYATIGERTRIKCDVPYSIDECAIQAPNGSFVSGGNFKDFYLGQCYSCEFAVQKSDLGLWRCYLSRPDSFEDSILTVEVQNFKMMKAMVATVEVDESDSLELMCRANSELVGCYFINPSGRSFHVSSKKSFSLIQYFGRGLKQGECGIRLDRVTGDDDGAWRCVGLQGTVDESYEISDKIIVQVNRKRVLTTATTVGLTAGLVMCSLLSFAFIYHYNNKTKRMRIEENINNR